ncbi:MAG: DUF5674 family protein [bacterium]|nr:DUF5674 family protein [bacterium]
MSVEIKIYKSPFAKTELRDIAQQQFGTLVKAVVDVSREIIAIGGELHADEEAVLLEDGSRQEDVWGINLYPEKSDDEWIEYDSMINVRPSQNNASRGVEDAAIREKITLVVRKLVI